MVLKYKMYNYFKNMQQSFGLFIVLILAIKCTESLPVNQFPQSAAAAAASAAEATGINKNNNKQTSYHYENSYSNSFANSYQYSTGAIPNPPQVPGTLPFPVFPVFPSHAPYFIPGALPLPPAEFDKALNQYLETVRQHYTSNGGSFTYASPGASAYAYTNLGPNNIYKHQQEAWNAHKNNVVSPNGQGGYAQATASHGPDGVQQTAGVYPQNPMIPNVDTMFSGNDPKNGHSNFVGIATSSFSSSSDVNGKKTSQKGAVTTINDNGKITTYKVGDRK